MPRLMEWTQQLDQYCERTDAGVLSEPLNLVSNVGFLLVAVLAWRRYRRRGRRDASLVALIAMVFVIGIGSALFHSVATRWARVADVAPIGLLVFVYLAHFLRRVVGMGWVGVVGGMVALVAASAAGSLIPRDWFNDSQGYFGTFAGMLALSALAWRTVGKRIALAAALFGVSLVLRSIDMLVCAELPIGTHFLWHACNAAVIYVLLAAAIDAANGTGPGTPRA